MSQVNSTEIRVSILVWDTPANIDNPLEHEVQEDAPGRGDGGY